MEDDAFGGDEDDFLAVSQAADRRPPPAQATGVVQPKPQALPSKTGPSAILVSPRQKGNPILQSIRALPWEYADMTADYVLGNTTCALFLSLKYHRLHPEYIYNRIRGLQGKYNLRVILTMVDIDNHEEPLKELSKTSLINNVTIILCWSAQEAGRYLELYKSFENAPPTSIRAHQSNSYGDRIVDFITVPRGINKNDAISLVSNFGSMRNAVRALPEEVALVEGWGDKKVKRWCSTVREPFRVRKAARRGVEREESRPEAASFSASKTPAMDSRTAARLGIASTIPEESDIAAKPRSVQAASEDPRLLSVEGPTADEEAAMLEASGEMPLKTMNTATATLGKRKAKDTDVSAGISAALEKLRKS